MKKKIIKIGNKELFLPLIQGGMGVGVSLSRLAGAVASFGGLGIISTAQIGFQESDFEQNPLKANLRAIKKHVENAFSISQNGPIGVNIMVATKNYDQYVTAAVDAGVDAVISGAGLPLDLPKYVKDSSVAIAPIVSSERAANIILKSWDRKFSRTADFLVIEGPKAGGHLGFSKEELSHIDALSYDKEIEKIISCKKIYEEKYQCSIPVFVAGGIFDASDVTHALSLGADGVQVATPFVTTLECDASDAYKNAYIESKEEDIVLVQSPVGMPGRAIHNSFLDKVSNHQTSITHCFSCLKMCNPAKSPYCITKALIEAVKGNLDEGLIFCGTNAWRLHEITSVEKVITSLFPMA